MVDLPGTLARVTRAALHISIVYFCSKLSPSYFPLSRFTSCVCNTMRCSIGSRFEGAEERAGEVEPKQNSGINTFIARYFFPFHPPFPFPLLPSHSWVHVQLLFKRSPVAIAESLRCVSPSSASGTAVSFSSTFNFRL